MKKNSGKHKDKYGGNHIQAFQNETVETNVNEKILRAIRENNNNNKQREAIIRKNNFQKTVR